MAPSKRARPNASRRALTQAAHRTGQTRLNFLRAVVPAPTPQPLLPLAAPVPLATLAPREQASRPPDNSTVPDTVVVDDDEPAPKRSKLGKPPSTCHVRSQSESNKVQVSMQETRQLRCRPVIGQTEATGGDMDAQDMDAQDMDAQDMDAQDMDAQDENAQDEDDHLPPVSAEYAAARLEFEAADKIDQFLLPKVPLAQYRPRGYADDWTPFDLHDLVLYVVRGLRLWTYSVSASVHRLISAHSAAESYADEFCERMKATSPSLCEMIDDCLERGVPWKLAAVLDCLPDALDSAICGNLVGNYLCGLHDLNGVFGSLAAYSGSCSGPTTSLTRRAKQHASPTNRARERSKQLYIVWDDPEHNMEPRLRMIASHDRRDIERYGPTLINLDESLNIVLFCAGWHLKAPHQLHLLPPALVQQWRQHEGLPASSSHSQIMETAMGCKATNVSIPILEKSRHGYVLQRLARDAQNKTECLVFMCDGRPRFMLTEFYHFQPNVHEWRQMHATPGSTSVIVEVQKSNTYHPENLAGVGPSYSHQDLPDVGMITLRITLDNSDPQPKGMFVRLPASRSLDATFKQDKRAMIAQTMWNIIQGIAVDPTDPFVYDFNKRINSQVDPGEIQEDLSNHGKPKPTGKKKLTDQSQRRFTDAYGHLDCPNPECDWHPRDSTHVTYAHYGLYHKASLTAGSAFNYCLRKSVACRQALLPLLKAGSPSAAADQVLSEGDIRGIHVAEYFGYTERAVRELAKKPREPIYHEYKLQLRNRVMVGPTSRKSKKVTEGTGSA